MLKTNQFPIESKLARIIILVFGIVLLLWIFDFRPLGYISGSWTTTSSERYSFQVDHPAKWVSHHYGEFGWHGNEEIKLRISGIDEGFNGVYVRWIPVENMSIEDAAALGKELIIQNIQPTIKRGEPGFSELDYYTSVIHDVQVIRRKYSYALPGEGIINEDVYIARADDLIIISLETSANSYNLYSDTFERILQSFKPLE